jgi:hypothetical protein
MEVNWEARLRQFPIFFDEFPVFRMKSGAGTCKPPQDPQENGTSGNDGGKFAPRGTLVSYSDSLEIWVRFLWYCRRGRTMNGLSSAVTHSGGTVNQ